jgi:hypothetical protein
MSLRNLEENQSDEGQFGVSNRVLGDVQKCFSEYLLASMRTMASEELNKIWASCIGGTEELNHRS